MIKVPYRVFLGLNCCIQGLRHFRRGWSQIRTPQCTDDWGTNRWRSTAQRKLEIKKKKEWERVGAQSRKWQDGCTGHWFSKDWTMQVSCHLHSWCGCTEVAFGPFIFSLCLLFCGSHHSTLLLPFAHCLKPYTTGRLGHRVCLPSVTE